MESVYFRRCLKALAKALCCTVYDADLYSYVQARRSHTLSSARNITYEVAKVTVFNLQN